MQALCARQTLTLLDSFLVTVSCALLLQELLAMEGAATQHRKAFLKAYSPYLVPVLVLGQHQDDLTALATTALGAAFNCRNLDSLLISAKLVDVSGLVTGGLHPGFLDNHLHLSKPQHQLSCAISLQRWRRSSCCCSPSATSAAWRCRSLSPPAGPTSSCRARRCTTASCGATSQVAKSACLLHGICD